MPDSSDDNIEKNKKKIKTNADIPEHFVETKSASNTTMQSDGKNFYCTSCGNYFYTATERNNHGCSIIEYKKDK
jgi:hypothetical protein